MRHHALFSCPLLIAMLVLGSELTAVAETAAGENSHAEIAPLVERGIAFLDAAQDENGSYSSFSGTGVTSLVTTALLRHGRGVDDPQIAQALEYLQTQVKPDGGIYKQGSRYRNYETCLAMLCFFEANRGGGYDSLLDGAEAFVKKLQWDGGEGHDESSTSYGGAGYGSHSRPDLSNTTYLIDALKTVGNGPDDPAMQRALAFVSRCQNLETEHNDTKFAAKNPDGGFYYTVAAGGTSQAGKTPGGGLRSYGSMTYAGLKSMIYAGVGPEDSRVQAAFEWAKQHYTISENPGMGNNGLYYYFHTFAKALDAIGEETIVDAEGAKHNWRQELIDELASRQQADGSWINSNERWLESDPNLVTGYVLLTLSYCRDDAGK